MDIRELPRRLFEEFGQDLQTEQGVEVATTPEKVTLVLRQYGSRGNIALQIWLDRQNALRDFGSVLFQIVAGVNEGGTWAYGLGHQFRETVYVQTGVGRQLHLTFPEAGLIARVIARAIELVESGEFVMTEFWESERDPTGTYIKP